MAPTMAPFTRPPLLRPTILCAVALALGGCNAVDRDRDPRAAADASPMPEVDIDDLQDDPAEHHGRDVRIVGEVDDPSYGDHAFVIQGDDWLFADEVLIVGTTPMRLGDEHLADGQDVVVIGKVWVGDMAGLEREVGWPIGENMADAWEDKAIVVARTVRATESGAEWNAPTHR